MIKLTLTALAIAVTSASASAATVTINASDANSFTYFNLETGTTSTSNGDWHIAFSKTKVKINEPKHGQGNVSAALAATPSGFYNNGEAQQGKFVSATPETEQYAYDQVSKSTTNSLTFIQSVLKPAIDTNLWYSNGQANDQNWWVIRSGDGTDTGNATYGRRFTKFHVTSIANGQLSIEYAWHTNNSEFGALKSISIPEPSSASCIDFDGEKGWFTPYPGVARTVSCSDNTWDLKVVKTNGKYQMWANSGVEFSGSALGETLGPVVHQKAIEMTNGQKDNDGRDLIQYYERDSAASSLFDTQKWYHYTAFNTSGGASMHSVYSNYRVFVIRDAAKGKDYKLQIMSYYNGTPSMFNGTAGTITFRYDALN